MLLKEFCHALLISSNLCEITCTLYFRKVDKLMYRYKPSSFLRKNIKVSLDYLVPDVQILNHLKDKCNGNWKAYVFIYLGFYVTFNTIQVISRRVVGRAEETSTYSSLGFCTVNCRPTASNYQLSHLRPCWGSNPGLRGGRRECYHSATVAPESLCKVNHKAQTVYTCIVIFKMLYH